jgi:hypothetical protein
MLSSIYDLSIISDSREIEELPLSKFVNLSNDEYRFISKLSRSNETIEPKCVCKFYNGSESSYYGF